MPLENNKLFNVQLADKNYGVFFYPKNDVVFSANKIYKIFTVFESPYIDGGKNGFVSWNKLKMNYNKYNDNEIYTYIRVSNNQDSNLAWNGPFLQQEYDISNFNQQFIQIRIVMSANYLNIISPILNSVNLSYFKLSSEEKFFTKTFNLGFKPKNIVLTYNGTIPDSTIIQFAVSGKDSVNSSDYHVINPNSTEDIGEIPDLTNKIKIMVSGVGNKNVPFIIDEFSIMLSGDKQAIIT